jgi:hypothetical protein
LNFYSDETYGERVAGVYDEWYSEYDPLAIDLMARLAGLQLRERWGNWNREPFTSESKKHISVYHSA